MPRLEISNRFLRGYMEKDLASTWVAKAAGAKRDIARLCSCRHMRVTHEIAIWAEYIEGYD